MSLRQAKQVVLSHETHLYGLRAIAVIDFEHLMQAIWLCYATTAGSFGDAP